MNTKGYKPTAKDCMLMEADPESGEILAQSLPLQYNKGWLEMIFMGTSFISRMNESPLFTQMFMDRFVSIGEEITPFIEIKSKNLVTEKDIRNISNNRGNRDVTAYFQTYLRENLKIFNMNSYVENDAFILFMYTQGSMNRNVVIINKDTGSAVLTQKLSNDLVFKNDENHYLGKFDFSDTKGVYEVVQARSIESFQESIRNNEVVPELDKLDDLRQLEDDTQVGRGGTPMPYNDVDD